MLLAAGAAHGEVTPLPGRIDPRIQTVDYDPNNVTLIRATTGYQVSIEFAPDERIENVAVGDSGAWQVTPNRRGDHLFVKPLRADVRTNLTVITDARTYTMVLQPADAGSAALPFVVRYRYAPAQSVVAMVAQEANRFRFSGARDLWPERMSDDGQRTTISWPPKVTLPAVFAIAADGSETSVNSHFEGGALVVESVAPKWVFRQNKHMARASIVERKR